MPDKPKRTPNPPTKRGRAWMTMPLDAGSSPEQAAKRKRRSRRDECVCQPWPCTPLTGCDSACRPCAKWGPFYTREDVRFLEGNPAPPASTHQEAS